MAGIKQAARRAGIFVGAETKHATRRNTGRHTGPITRIILVEVVLIVVVRSPSAITYRPSPTRNIHSRMV